MKILLLMRHGKSDWSAPFSHDHDRPLAKRGRKAAKLMGRALTNMGEAPEQVVSSSATRARDTAKLAIRAGGWPASLEITEVLYGAHHETVLEVVHAQNDAIERLMLVGHEPHFSSWVQAFCGGRVSMPTAAIAALEFQLPLWRQVHFGQAQLRYLLRPRLLEKICC